VNSAGMPVKDYSFVFEISQRTQDLHLNLIACYFKTGKVYTETSGVSRFIFRSKDPNISTLVPILDPNISTLVPHFRDYPLEGHKSLQYLAWLKAVTILTHQTKTSKRDTELEMLIKELSSLN
jgi:hypothetical protein